MDLLLQASAFVPAYKYTWPGHHLAYGPGNFTALPHTFNLSMLASSAYRKNAAEKREEARQNYIESLEPHLAREMRETGLHRPLLGLALKESAH